ncbi:MAG TPA: DNA repair protein RecO [Solirubrobacterales bacterium]|jgi:DNA repair protein RecO (recombination protein O)|nr:DNA repair protein RecO [Solirubrobacterales bacterium]
MANSFKTEAIVLRKLRYGEADSILHLYTRDHGRIGAIAKGVRRSKSRFGGRLEPFFRLELVLHEGRGDLATITSAETLSGYSALRDRARSLETASKVGDFVLRLLDDRERNLPAYNLIVNMLGLLDDDIAAARAEVSLAFRGKMLLAAGFSPELGSCVSCGSQVDLVAFSPSSGGVVCRDCRERGDFDFSAEAHKFLSEAIGSPLASAPHAERYALIEVDKAITETLAHHAQVRIRSAL